ncbi:hypothetical protein B0A55_12986 [Friedmanniomyces simplex]|uniref:Uncharacterized protein n=1 Tax=Friedmanniomyces simplex TaxID=329884 RepID=A0A4U0WHU9_9PEZI|nr:hypothetical protein B0A55_12986 [Friedmanniomyces simplex]
MDVEEPPPGACLACVNELMTGRVMQVCDRAQRIEQGYHFCTRCELLRVTRNPEIRCTPAGAQSLQRLQSGQTAQRGSVPRMVLNMARPLARMRGGAFENGGSTLTREQFNEVANIATAASMIGSRGRAVEEDGPPVGEDDVDMDESRVTERDATKQAKLADRLHREVAEQTAAKLENTKAVLGTINAKLANYKLMNEHQYAEIEALKMVIAQQSKKRKRGEGSVGSNDSDDNPESAIDATSKKASNKASKKAATEPEQSGSGGESQPEPHDENTELLPHTLGPYALFGQQSVAADQRSDGAFSSRNNVMRPSSRGRGGRGQSRGRGGRSDRSDSRPRTEPAIGKRSRQSNKPCRWESKPGGCKFGPELYWFQHEGMPKPYTTRAEREEMAAQRAAEQNKSPEGDESPNLDEDPNLDEYDE